MCACSLAGRVAVECALRQRRRQTLRVGRREPADRRRHEGLERAELGREHRAAARVRLEHHGRERLEPHRRHHDRTGAAHVRSDRIRADRPGVGDAGQPARGACSTVARSGPSPTMVSLVPLPRPERSHASSSSPMPFSSESRPANRKPCPGCGRRAGVGYAVGNDADLLPRIRPTARAARRRTR